MNKLIYFFALCILLLTACNREHILPPNVLPKEKMMNLLMDMYLLEANAYHIPYGDSSRRVTKAGYFYLMDKYQIDTIIIKTSIDYYLSDPVSSAKMYEQMLDSLEKYKTKMVMEADSIRKLTQDSLGINNMMGCGSSGMEMQEPKNKANAIPWDARK